MNYIGIDISKVSTAVVVEVGGVEHIFSYNNKKPNYKWNKEISDLVGIRTYEYDNGEEDYSKSEINKLSVFIKISNDIIGDILSVIDASEETVIAIEGYSYGKSSDLIIDLVGIGGLVRAKIYENVPNIKEMRILSPKKLKTVACELAYGSSTVTTGKRVLKEEVVINTNPSGTKGGDFDKHDMFRSIVDSGIKYKLCDYIRAKYDEITSSKSFPKPLEDIDDAFWLKEAIKDQKRT